MRVREANERAAIRTGEAVSCVRIRFHDGINGTSQQIPDSSWVEFDLPDGEVRVNLNEEAGERFLQVSTDHMLIVQPRASNMIHVRQAARRAVK